MNERIKQLIEQAEIKFESHPQHQGIDTAVIIPTDLEKFAELIVKKCADVAKYYTPDTEECEHTWLIHDKIKQHFGVEQ